MERSEQLLGRAASPPDQNVNLFWNSDDGQQDNIPINHRSLPALTYPQFMTLEPSASVCYLELLRSHGAVAHFNHLTESMGMNRMWIMDELEAHLLNCIRDEQLTSTLRQLSLESDK